MKSKIVKLEYQVNCDLCEQSIHAGEKCRISTDKETGRAYFEHLRCPDELMPAIWHNPIFPMLNNAHRLVSV